MSMILKEAKRVHEGMTVIEYNVKHSTPGLNGTTLDSPLRLTVIQGGECQAKLDVYMGVGPTPKDAIEKLISNLERMIEGLKQRRDTWVPL